MSNNDHAQTELPELFDDGFNNNYCEWEIRSYHKLREWDLLKFIEGPTSQAPIIPPLHHPAIYDGIDDDGNPSTVHVPGNQAEHEQALRDAIPWMTGNNIALSRIIRAIPKLQLHLVMHAKYAKEAWESLRSMYQTRSTLLAATRKNQIMAYRCQPEMNIERWLNDMQRLYNSLCNLDTDCMSDRDFALAILDLVPPGRDEGWQNFLSGLWTQVRVSDSQGLPIYSATFITAIRDYCYLHKGYDYQTTSHAPSALSEEDQRPISRTKKRARKAFTSGPNPASKRARTQDAGKDNRQCSNPFCSSPRGHDTANCVSYKGAKEGQYGEWWRGPWNLHLPESQRTKENNKPPKKHPVRIRAWIQRAQREKAALQKTQANSVQVDKVHPSHLD